MATRTVNICDVCHKDGVPGLYRVDMGNDYTTPREFCTGALSQKARVVLDFCGPCYSALLDWVHQRQPNSKGEK